MGLVDTKKTVTEKPLLWIGVAIVALSLITLGVVVFLRMNSNVEEGVLAVVAGEKIYQKDLNEKIYGIDFEGTPDTPPSVDNKEKQGLLDLLVQVKVAEKEASSLGVTVTDEEVEAQISDRLGYNFEDYTAYQKEITRKSVKSEILLKKVTDKSIGLKSGKMFVCRFDQPYEWSLDVNLAENQAKTQELKTYSEKLCNDLYSDVASGKITFEQAMDKAEADKVVGKPLWGDTYSMKIEFSKRDFETRRYFRDSVNLYDVLNTIHKDETLKPTLINLKNDEDQNKNRESFYVVAKIYDEVNSEYTSKESWFEAMKKKYNIEYKVNY